LAQAYAAAAGKLKEADPHAAEVLAALREMIGRPWHKLRTMRVGSPNDSDQLSALAQAYAAVTGKLKEADPHAAEELAALRETIDKTTHPGLLSALAQAYATVAKRARPATAPVQDVAVLLGRIGDLRSPDECNAFVAAILAALRLGSPPLNGNQAGLIVTAMLLQPISAGEPTRQLIQGYEKLVREGSDFPKLEKSWSGDVWAFANWARKNLSGFDPHHPQVGFLPSVALGAQRAIRTIQKSYRLCEKWG